MNKKLKGGILVLAGVAMLPAQALADPILLQRCNADSLDSAQAAKRIEWARKCGLIKNVGSPSYAFDTEIPASNGGTLFDYLETDYERNPDGEGAFSGDNYGFEVNATFANTLFLSGATNQSIDPAGSHTAGYRRWARDASRQRPRPLYPTFGSSANLTDAGNAQLWPVNADLSATTDCNLYANQTNTNASTQSASAFVNGYCEASCYTPDQEVLFARGYVSILDALNSRRDDLMTLTPDSTLDNVRMKKNRTYSYTVETRDSQHEIYVLKTRSGGELRVTSEHPVVDGAGRMVQAQTLKVGDDLVRADGTLDPIETIEKVSHVGKVYNLSPMSEDLVSNVLVAQGFLVGSSRFQNDDVSYMNRIILYKSAPAQIIP